MKLVVDNQLLICFVQYFHNNRLFQIQFFFYCRSSDAVTMTDHFFLSLYSKIRLILTNSNSILNCAQCMEYSDMWYIPPTLQPSTHPTGYPIVAMYQVVIDTIALSETFQITGKILQIGVDYQLVYVLDLSCLQVDKTNILRQMKNLAILRIMSSSININ